jgi:outer membrane protein assembly factor BamA
MSGTIRIFVAFLFGVPWILNAQLRTDLLESARDAKEAALTPERPPKAERGIVRAEDSLAYRLLTGEARGFGVAFGQIAPGSGFSVGPKYKRTDLLSGRLTFSVEARATITESYLGRMELSLPHLLDDRGSLDFTVQHRNISEMSYYGPGPDSEKTGRSDYRLEDTNVELRPAYRPFRKLRVGMIGSYLAVNVGQGHADRYISAERQYTPAQAPGIDRQTDFWRGGGFVEFDWRDRPHNPRSGGKYSAQYTRFLDRELGSSSFFRLDLDAAQYIPLLNLTKVIVLHGSTSLTEAGSGQRVPFYLQPMLGGSDTLRGYRPYRFYGDNSVLVNAEYRWDLSPILQAVAFADGGKVFNHWEQWNLHALESDVGFGIRVRGRSAVVFSFDTGFSHEGFQLWFRVNNMF